MNPGAAFARLRVRSLSFLPCRLLPSSEVSPSCPDIVTLPLSSQITNLDSEKILASIFRSYTEDIGYYDYRPVTLLFACFISFQRHALS